MSVQPYGSQPQGPPPPVGYQPSPFAQPGNTTVVVAQPQSFAVPDGTNNYHQMPCLIQCQYCGSVVTTSTQYTVGTFTWLIGLIICLVGCDLGCCLIPCCMDGCKDVIHTCPNCGQTVGRYNRM